MQSTTRTAARSLCAPFCLVLLVAGVWSRSQAQVFGPDSREARFPKIGLRSRRRDGERERQRQSEDRFLRRIHQRKDRPD